MCVFFLPSGAFIYFKKITRQNLTYLLVLLLTVYDSITPAPPALLLVERPVRGFLLAAADVNLCKCPYSGNVDESS